MTTVAEELDTKVAAAKSASRELARLPTRVKNRALLNVAEGLLAHQAKVLHANAEDLDEARTLGLSESLLDRTLLTSERLEAMAADVRRIADLPDPVGETFDERVMTNGLRIGKRRVPLGVIAAVYESRPNVTIDISSLCLKSGNAVVLRGGKEAFHSNKVLAGIVRRALAEAGAPEEAVQFVESTDRTLVNRMLQMSGSIDLMVPRGSAGLIRFVYENATMPVVAGGIGVCHTYLDSSADLEMAREIVYNAKVQRPSVCNALDTVLVHRAIAEQSLPDIGRALAGAGVELRCDPAALAILREAGLDDVKEAAEDDWGMEFLDLIAAVKVVDSFDEALGHIEHYGSGHSEAIVTSDYASANQFMDRVDAAAVYVNASTRFTDGAEFGLGAEIGISTQKFHARGPMGLQEMTSYKWTIFGDGQARP